MNKYGTQIMTNITRTLTDRFSGKNLRADERLLKYLSKSRIIDNPEIRIKIKILLSIVTLILFTK